MFHLSFRRIENDFELLEIFSETVAKYGGVRIPTEYNKASETWGIFIDGKLIGGYVIASGNVMRVPNIVPPSVIEESAFLRKFKRIEWCEVNQVWLSDDVTNYSVSLRMWLHIRSRVLKSGYSIVLVPWVSQNAGIDRFYRGFTSHILFKGSPAGKVGHSVELVVGIATMNDVKWTSLKFFPDFIKKILIGKKRNPRHLASKERGNLVLSKEKA
jgi:hypothetical protein